MSKESYQMDEEDEKPKESKTFGPINFDHFINRDEKIAMYRRKKEIETQLDMLRDYKDEDMKRQFFMTSLSHSIVRSLEQLGIIFQEVKLLEHQQTLPRDENNRPF